ncbi:hypothetical protein AAHK20_32970 [Trinickia sp. YCB016]
MNVSPRFTLRALALAAGVLLAAMPPGFAVEIPPEGAAASAAAAPHTAASNAAAPDAAASESASASASASAVSASASPAQAGDAASDTVADTNLFPPQTFDSLSPAAPPPAQAQIEVPPAPLDVAAAPEMEAPPPQEMPLPFVPIAEWRDNKRQAFAVEGLGQIFVFCGKCRVTGAVHPGQTIAAGYQLEKLDETHALATLLTPEGKERAFPLVGMTH